MNNTTITAYRKASANLLLLGIIASITPAILYADAASKHQERESLVRGRLPVSEANILVTNWFKNLGGFHAANLHEITPAAVWTKTHGQIFEDATDLGGDGFYIKDKRVYHISTGFGGFGINDIVVCDIDGDKYPEVVYTYSWGSGLHRAQIGVIDRCEKDPAVVELNYMYRNYDLTFKNKANRVLVYAMDRGNPHFAKYYIGELKLQHSKLSLTLSPKLTKQQHDLYTPIPLKK